MPGEANTRAEVILRSNSSVPCSLVGTKWSVMVHFILVDSLLGYKLVWHEIREVLESKYLLIPHYELLDISLDCFKLRGQLVYNGLKKEANSTKYLQGLLCLLKSFEGLLSVVFYCYIYHLEDSRQWLSWNKLAFSKASHLPGSQFYLLKKQWV